mgnify:CR=1 FL=1
MTYIFLIIILILSVIIHEIAHGAAAFHLGDPTAKMMGRLSLNPIKHLDPVGSIIVPLFLIIIQSPILIGWAKPVPVNPANFKDQKYGNAKVSLAGPGVNIGIAILFGLLLRFTGGFGNPGLQLMFSYIVLINLILAIFNLIPIPPLDGSHILFTFLPDSMNSLKVTLQRYGFFILIFFIFFFLQFLFPLITSIFRLIVGSPAPF